MAAPLGANRSGRYPPAALRTEAQRVMVQPALWPALVVAISLVVETGLRGPQCSPKTTRRGGPRCAALVYHTTFENRNQTGPLGVPPGAD